MIVQLKNNSTPQEQEDIRTAISNLGYKTTDVVTQFGHYLIGIGKKEIDLRVIGHLPGITDIHRVSDDYKLVSRKWKVQRTQIDLGDGVVIGDGSLSIMAGPCSIETEEQIESTIAHLKANGVRIMRGGVFKPRSSPYAFRGLGVEGLKMWYQAARKSGIKIISEVMQVSQIAEMYEYTD